MIPKPDLSLLPPNATAEQIVALFTKLTGRQPSPAEIDELKSYMVMGDSEQPPINPNNSPDADTANADWPKRTKDVMTP